MRDDVLTVSPNRQYRGIFRPTTPAHTGPVERGHHHQLQRPRPPTPSCPPPPVLLTAVDADPQPQLLLRPVANHEGAYGVQQSERHAGDLPAMEVSVSYRQPRHHHVGITDGLHLQVAPSSLTLSVCVTHLVPAFNQFIDLSNLFVQHLIELEFDVSPSLSLCPCSIFLSLSLLYFHCIFTSTGQSRNTSCSLQSAPDFFS